MTNVAAAFLFLRGCRQPGPSCAAVGVDISPRRRRRSIKPKVERTRCRRERRTSCSAEDTKIWRREKHKARARRSARWHPRCRKCANASAVAHNAAEDLRQRIAQSLRDLPDVAYRVLEC